MASRSLYRKWRSQTFSDLVGQEAITRTLRNAAREGRLAHAYLFCGPRGTGKTSAARLLAKAINCAQPHDGEPCNECVSCREITAGNSPDVIEIDAASNNGVDNIRDLRQSAGLLGSGGHYKLYVVDEAHMLSPQAFNALLKTLEEPPPHVIFVLATTEAQKVLPTVVSRCQRFDFRRISARDIVARLCHIAQGEGLALDAPAAELLARAAQGGLRDAVSLLDQAMAYCGATITLERVREMLGLADPEAVRRLIEQVAERQTAEGLHAIHQMVSGGADLRQVQQQLTEEWRALLLARAGADVALLMGRTDDEARAVATLAQRFSLEELMACARVFARGEAPARGLPIPQLALELAFLECVAIRGTGESRQPEARPAPASAQPRRDPEPLRQPEPHVTTPPSETLERAALDHDGSSPQPRAHAAHAAHERATPPPERANERSDATTPDTLAAAPSPAPATPPVAAHAGARGAEAQGAEARPPHDSARAASGDGGDDELLRRVRQGWPLIKRVCKQKSSMLSGLLNSAEPVDLEPGDPPLVVLAVRYPFHLEKLREPGKHESVEWSIAQVVERPVRVRFVLADDAPTGARSRTTGRAAPTPSPATPTGDRATAAPTPPPAPLPAPSSSAAPRADAPALPAAHTTPESAGAEPATLEDEVRDDPVIQDLMRAFDAQLVEVRALTDDDDAD